MRDWSCSAPSSWFTSTFSLFGIPTFRKACAFSASCSMKAQDIASYQAHPSSLQSLVSLGRRAKVIEVEEGYES